MKFKVGDKVTVTKKRFERAVSAINSGEGHSYDKLSIELYGMCLTVMDAERYEIRVNDDMGRPKGGWDEASLELYFKPALLDDSLFEV
jgi:hypothetical protein